MKFIHRRTLVTIAAGLLIGLAGLVPGVRDAGKDLAGQALPALTYWDQRVIDTGKK